MEDELKGGGKKQIEVLSEYGPNRRDHRRWKRDPSDIQLEVGDPGVFFLSQHWLKKVSKRHPDKEGALRERYLFQNGLAGVYLTRDGKFDSEFLKVSGKSQQALAYGPAMADARSLKQYLGEDAKK